MKKLILIFPFFTILGCTKLSRSFDHFERKVTCSGFISKENARIEKESDLDLKMNNGFPDSVTTLDKVCYSEKYNTCVGFYQVADMKPKEGKNIFKIFSAIDLLTTERIDFVHNGLENPEKTDDAFKVRRQELSDKIACAN